MESLTIFFQRNYNCILGVYCHERNSKQLLSIDLQLSLANTSDQSPNLLADIDRLIDGKLSIEQPFLLERLAFILGNLIMESFPVIRALELTIKKPRALSCAENANVNIRISQAL